MKVIVELTKQRAIVCDYLFNHSYRIIIVDKIMSVAVVPDYYANELVGVALCTFADFNEDGYGEGILNVALC